jgi:hypothetical protein
MIKLFKQALNGSGVGGSQAQNIMLQFGDLIKTNDERLRRDLSQLDG